MIEDQQKIANANILIVDDKADNVRLLEMMLSFSGYSNVQSTTDSRKVLGLAQKTEFDLILLDIRMPHLDGFDVMAQLADLNDGGYIPVLVLTAQNDMDTRLKALQLGARDFVTKPFDKGEVLNRISNMLEVRLLYNERKHQNEILEEMVRNRTLELERRNMELDRTRLEVVRRLGRAGEYRDNETGMHVVRMSKSSQVLAQAAGLSEEQCELILNASPMHDVGKIGIPDGILLKPGRFEPDEWKIMKTHVQIGADIIGNDASPLMKMARIIALNHHEKWDGTGYPNAIKGEDIPIEGRICAICDVFDALTSERPYKKAWTVDDAVELINKESGVQFDPKLVVLFNECLPEIIDIREQYADAEF